MSLLPLFHPHIPRAAVGYADALEATAADPQATDCTATLLLVS